MNTSRTSRGLRAGLLTSAAFSLIALASVAQAQDVGAVGAPNPDEAVLEAQSTGPTIATLDQVQPDPQIVIGAPGTPTTARDPVNVNGVGQMIIDNRDGTIGLCTGTLINPRTVIFAAHCVNSRAANAYGSATGGTAIGFGFSNNNNAAGNSAFGNWLNGYQTNTGRYMYTVNQVAYNAASLDGASGGFRQADVAIATLDTPAKDVPTWALLLSALPQTAGGTPAGTGYHVTITGYGNNGTGATGSSGGIDYRRRIAENMIGALTSLDDFTSFLFGSTTGSLPQNLYWIDFDDPRRGTASADPRDFNAFRDQPTPNEGITASGDSGGPLILDRIGNQNLAKQLVIGVLSGGYTRFFNGAPANGYGTASFYQPLYLYWDWIAANNPYRYVSSVAGNGNWTDGAHWVTNVDPNYIIIGPNGQFVNGVPTNVGTGTAAAGGDFGEACFESGGSAECYNFATGDYTLDTRPIGGANSPGIQHLDGTGDATNDSATVSTSTLGGSAQGYGIESVVAAEPEAQAGGGQSANALPAATIANGLPGATNFVPNNIAPNPGQNVIGRYFDVTLGATGTTTLSSAVTIDRFAIANGGAMLDITSTGSLTSIMDITQTTGTMQVNGALISSGDYLMVSGGLNGTGTITVPFYTNMLGTIAPGTAGTVGTLTFRGNIVLASGGRVLADLGANGVSDRIAVQANGTGTGLASVGGQLVLNPSAAVRAGNSYTVLTAAGGIGGSTSRFNSVVFNSASAILTPNVTYTSTAVTVTLVAGQYGNVINRNDPNAVAYGILLDRNRSQASRFDSIYGVLDLADAGSIRSSIATWTPAAETTAQSLGLISVGTTANFLRDRIGAIEPGQGGGTIARYGAVNSMSQNLSSQPGVAGMSGMGFGGVASTTSMAPMIQENALPDNMSAFFAGGYLNGNASPMAGLAGRDQYDGWYASAGLELNQGNATVGFALTYSRLDGDSAFVTNHARSALYQGTLYGKMYTAQGWNIDAMLTAGLLDLDTTRNVSILGTPYTLTGSNNSLVVLTDIGISRDFDLGAARVTPRVSGRATYIGFSRGLETGGPTALMIDRDSIGSYQGRAGLTIAATGKIRPWVTGTYVHEFNDRSPVIGANFVGGVGGNVLFALNGQDTDWGEISGGLTLSTGSVDFSVSAETTVERTDIKGQAYRGSISFRF